MVQENFTFPWREPLKYPKTPEWGHALGKKSKTWLNPMHKTYVKRAANAGTRSNPSWSCCPGRTFWTSPWEQNETIMIYQILSLCVNLNPKTKQKNNKHFTREIWCSKTTRRLTKQRFNLRGSHRSNSSKERCTKIWVARAKEAESLLLVPPKTGQSLPP